MICIKVTKQMTALHIYCLSATNNDLWKTQINKVKLLIVKNNYLPQTRDRIHSKRHYEWKRRILSSTNHRNR